MAFHCSVSQLCPILRPHGLQSPPDSSVHGILQSRILDWAALSFSRGSSPARDQTASPELAGGFFTTESLGKPISRYEHSIIHNLIPELLRLNCRPMPNTSWSDTNLPLIVQAPILFCVLFTLIHDKSGREPACQCRRHNRCRLDIWVGKIPWRRAWQPAPVFLPGESREQGSLVGHRPWGCKELDMTEAA